MAPIVPSPLAPAWLAVPDDPNALGAALWPDTARRDADGEISLGGVPVSTLAERFGTPLYVVDAATVRTQAHALHSAFADAFAPLGQEPTLYYAGKAFLCAQMVRWVRELGLSLDVASGGELALALAAGMPAGQIGLHGNNKSEQELTLALEAGVGTVIVDSDDEIRMLAELARAHGVRQRVRLRVTTGVHASTHDYLATATEDQKFGIALADAPATVARIRAQSSLEFVGMHSHIGSQIFAQEGFAEAIRRLMGVQAVLLQDGPAPELDLGGGFGISYTTADRPRPLAEIAQGIVRALRESADEHGIPVPKVSFEPGRQIIGRAGTTLYRTGVIKDVTVHGEGGQPSGVRRYVAVDGGMSDNPRPELYGADYHAVLASRASGAAPGLVRVVGKHCESGDIVVDADYLPEDVRRDDLLLVAATGAYCHTLSSNYNLLPRRAVVAVEDGRAWTI
ncbi:MAG: diaminopimelate decarboxylase, partial [Microbacteriaceae bacterium]|nr:diaminopimelate decarboxylase [Microbacteriaceae bacterium]